ncbi:hypothetical protein [Plantactinospora sp. B5E13]|uniref:hypothetical protein n=1 Tax=Plantactinospora sp. B5E13 TaxID=3153758 RepID=UPI00325CD9CB
MSYEQLAQHAAEIERTAIVKSMERRGFTQDSQGVWQAGSDVERARVAGELTVSRFQGVSDMFTPFLNMPDPARFDPLLTHLGETLKILSSGNTEADPVYRAGVAANDDLLGMNTVGKALQDWRGSAAAAFRQNFVEPFPAVTTNQFALVATLRGAVDAEQAMWSRRCGRPPGTASTTSPTRRRWRWTR